MGKKMTNKNFDDFDDEFHDESRGIQNFLTIIAVVVAAGGFLALSWYAYNSYNNSVDSEIPLIKAENSAKKITPADPGGMDFPNMDKKVYSKLSKDHEKIKIERILPSPEEPLTKDEIAKDYPTNNKIENSPKEEIQPKENNLANQESSTSNEINAKKADTQTTTNEQNLSESANSQAKPEEHNQNIADQNPAAVITKLPTGSKFDTNDYKMSKTISGYRIQLASFKTELDAKNTWNHKVQASTGLLDQFNYHIEKKIIPNKGLVYRLQIGNFESESEAAELCKKLKTKNIDCFLVRP